MMSIDKAHRGNGYGGEIIKELLTWFKKRGITEVKLKVFTNNHGAVKAYNKLGFEAYSTDMRLDI
jgi:RimJ/RimL family protein N-acetyltransferase